MANHLHKQIRDAVVTALTGLATTGSRVYANRLAALPQDTQPTLLVTLDTESAEAVSIHGPVIMERTLELSVAAVAKASTGLDDTLDQAAKEVETALAGGITVGGRSLVPLYAGMEFEDDLGDKPTAVKRMRFSLTYSAMSNAPDTLI